MDTALVLGIISAIAALIGGGGGVFAFIISRQKNNHDEHSSSVLEWKQLYDEMKERLDGQEEDNKKLREEIFELKKEMSKLGIELDGYKRFDNYIYELESYIIVLLDALKTLITEDAYNNIVSKRPSKNVNITSPKDNKKK